MAEVAPQYHSFSLPSSLIRDHHHHADEIQSEDLGHEARASSSSPALSPSHHPAGSGRPLYRGLHLQTLTSISADLNSSSPNSAARSPAPLPAFSFNPSTNIIVPDDVTLPLQATTTPAVSAPSTPIHIQTSSRRHRRTVSELIGGAEVPTHSIAIRRASVDPRITDSLAQPETMGSPPPRRGHRHQRSGVFASQDFKPLLINPACQFGNIIDTPTHSSHDSAAAEQSQSPAWTLASAHVPSQEVFGLGSDHPQTPPRSPSRARVGFSDTVEFISRPTSLISFESGSSVSTIRETSGSISAVLNGPGISPLAKAVRSPLKSVIFDDQPTHRPRSASPRMRARMLRSGVDKHDSLPQRPISAGSSPRSRSHLSKSTSFDSRMRLQEADLAEPIAHRNTLWTQVFGSSGHPTSRIMDGAYDRSDPCDLNTIVGEEEAHSRRTSAELSENFDEDPTSIIVSGPPRFEIPIWKPYYGGADSHEPTSPMIDLDAAFDPVSSSPSDSRSFKGRSFSAARQSMHSSNLASGFFGAGMHYHRRAESEPSLVRHDSDSTSFRRRPSASGHEQAFEMENVFEDDEDESPAQMCKSASGAASTTSGRIAVVDAEQYGDAVNVPSYGSLADPFVESDMPKGSDMGAFVLHHPHFDQAPRSRTPQSDTDPCSCAHARNVDSRSVGANSLDIRHSVDDVPSLMSSGSTMTDAVQVLVPSISSRGGVPRSTASSLSIPADVKKQYKRSSIASFSRFIASPFDRSTTPMERRRSQVTDFNTTAKPRKVSRLQRFLTFLKA